MGIPRRAGVPPAMPVFVPAFFEERLNGRSTDARCPRFEGLVNLLQHAAVKLRAGLVDAGRINKNDLRGRVCTLVGRDLDYAHDATARGLRLGGDDGHLFAGEGVKERAFADGGPAENGNKSRFQWVAVLLLPIIADWKVER